MKFMLMMNTPGGGAYQIAQWPAKDIQAHIAFMKQFTEGLARQGELVAAEGLAGPDQAKLVRGDESGKPQTDGVFPESKEFLAGYWIVQVDSAQRAYEIAARASMAPGVAGKPLHLGIEVREVMSAPPAQ
ncbi:MAG: YciI family protein [Polyangiaceae bacterium]